MCTSIIVACALRFGAEKEAYARVIAQWKAVLSALEIVPCEEPADGPNAELRRHPE